MPFAGFKDFDACLTEQLKNGKSKESAEKICGSLKAKFEKSDAESPPQKTRIDEYFQKAIRKNLESPALADQTDLPTEFPIEQFKKGLQQEAKEHLQSVGGDMMAIARIVLDHLSEDKNAYGKGGQYGAGVGPLMGTNYTEIDGKGPKKEIIQ